MVGATAAVWTTCLLFFQLALLLGYLYSHALVRYLKPRAQAMVHGALLLASAADGFIRGDDQQDEVNAADAGQHIADKTFVAGNIDETQTQDSPAGGRARQSRTRLRPRNRAVPDGRTRSMVMPRRFSLAGTDGVGA